MRPRIRSSVCELVRRCQEYTGAVGSARCFPAILPWSHTGDWCRHDAFRTRRLAALRWNATHLACSRSAALAALAASFSASLAAFSAAFSASLSAARAAFAAAFSASFAALSASFAARSAAFP